MSPGAGEAHILNVCVRDEFRTVGVGEAFLEVRPSNLAAIRL